MLYYEKKLKTKGYDIIIGVDEAGRGPLAGPVVAAAVSLNSYCFESHIDDSKKLTPKARETAFWEIIHKSIFGIGIINEKIIDRINILEASRLAMEEAVAAAMDKLGPALHQHIHIIVDGNIRLNVSVPCLGIVRGDTRSKSIASASILAKVVRDRIMLLYDRIYPQYGFRRHKGYPTQAHRRVLKRLGPCLIHRESFDGVWPEYIFR